MNYRTEISTFTDECADFGSKKRANIDWFKKESYDSFYLC